MNKRLMSFRDRSIRASLETPKSLRISSSSGTRRDSSSLTNLSMLQITSTPRLPCYKRTLWKCFMDKKQLESIHKR